MDLGAYSQIDDLSGIMHVNGIKVPRLRGLRLMKDETPVTKEEMESIALENGLLACKDLCDSNFHLNAYWFELSARTKRLRKKFLITEGGYWPKGIRWQNLHGKRRKIFKFCMKIERKKVFNNIKVFNKYCGREDVLYIHARIGGGNWNYFGGPELAKQPWFIEKVDDHFDETYCDIYARIDPEVKYGQSENS